MNFSRQWFALGREADLAVQQVASGVTALGSALYSNSGFYIQAFFGLSIGFERFAKLAIVADYCIEHHGAFPTDAYLRTYGHKLDDLFVKCDELSLKYREGKKYSKRPNDEIHNGIVQTLAEFARATRYYNLDFISGARNSSLPEPIGAWSHRVGAPILSRHRPANRRERIQAESDALSDAVGDNVVVHFHAEDGSEISNFAEMSVRATEAMIVQKYGRMYVLQIARWLAYLIHEQSFRGSYQLGVEPLFGIYERVAVFMHEDNVFRKRKIWPPR